MLEVTVVLATYNGESYLQEQLESLAAQSRRPDRLFVSDDGSTDSTWQVLAAFARIAPFPVELVRRDQRLGAQHNFARSLEEIEGDVVFFCDQDDRWHPDKIATVSELFERDDRLGMVLNDAAVTDERLHPIGESLFEHHHLDESDFALMRNGRAFRVFATKMPPYGSTTALRLDVAKACLPLPDGATYDQWIGQLASLSAEVAVIPRPLQDYRQHSTQVTGFQGGSKLSRALRRRRAHNRAELRLAIRRLRLLQQRLSGFDPHVAAVAEATALTAGRLTLEQRRLRVRSQSYIRPFSVGLLLVTGGYHRYARGFSSAALDLVAKR